jgi:hypothetical protein
MFQVQYLINNKWQDQKILPTLGTAFEYAKKDRWCDPQPISFRIREVDTFGIGNKIEERTKEVKCKNN